MMIREMQERDWPRVAAIYQQGIESNMATFQNAVPTYEAWDNAHLPCCRLVAEAEGLVVGWVALSPTSPLAVFRGVAEVSIYLDVAWQRRGIGRQLMQALFVASEPCGIWCVESRVFADNQPSLLLHQRCGFRQVGIREAIGFDEKIHQWRNLVLLERRSTTVGVSDAPVVCAFDRQGQ